ncbi:MAG TPA: hypothetical protein PLT47_02745 [Bacteroidales bacterium]|nr:hypothetical protein [Bacteroidales bacterium]HQI69639.1 hypothetical protein [Bacteroidales bacterium]
MTQETDNEDDIEKLRIENEKKKLMLSLEHGAYFSESDGTNSLDPRLEAEFLDHIEQFENAYQDCKQISVYDFIGEPDFKKAEDVPDKEMPAELEKIMNLLNGNSIYLDTICEVADRELYRFITEEFFLHEIDDIRVDGMMHNFIYEEFHPNHEYDIREHSTDFMTSFLDKESEYYPIFLTKEAQDSNVLKNFRDAFTSFSLEHFEIKSLCFDEEKASVTFHAIFSGTVEGSAKIQKFSGEGKIELIYQYDFWCIQSVVFPSVSQE